ncbi:Ubiquitin--protein ligase [Bertholletia excelsa]
MAEYEIAKSMADLLNKLQRPSDEEGDVSESNFRGDRSKLGREEVELARLHAKTAELALNRARAWNREFKKVMEETEILVSVELARILADQVDPVVDALRKAVVEEGHVCGVCQDEMVVGEEARAMTCGHTFHGSCIFKWLHFNNACPLCRYGHHH